MEDQDSIGTRMRAAGPVALDSLTPPSLPAQMSSTSRLEVPCCESRRRGPRAAAAAWMCQAALGGEEGSHAETRKETAPALLATPCVGYPSRAIVPLSPPRWDWGVSTTISSTRRATEMETKRNSILGWGQGGGAGRWQPTQTQHKKTKRVEAARACRPSQANRMNDPQPLHKHSSLRCGSDGSDGVSSGVGTISARG